jgi:hypothetical protein
VKRRKLTPDQRERVRILVEDEGWTYAEAVALVLGGVA